MYLPVFSEPILDFFGSFIQGNIGICVPTRLRAGENVGNLMRMPEARNWMILSSNTGGTSPQFHSIF